jgi:hypothetical protein
MRRNLALDFGGGYRVLDACCRVGAEWATSRRHDCVMSDSDIACRPAVVSDMRFLPFADESFEEIFFDPPHMIRNDKWSTMYQKNWRGFGFWRSRAEWENALRLCDSEFARVIRPGGVLHVKILDGPDRRVTKRLDLELLASWRVASERREPPATPWSKAEVVFAEMVLRGARFIAKSNAAAGGWTIWDGSGDCQGSPDSFVS